MGRKKFTPRVVSNPLTYLTAYITLHYPELKLIHSYSDERGGFALCEIPGMQGRHGYHALLRVPADAPPDARPLFDTLFDGNTVVWKFVDNYRPEIPWGERRRLHMYFFEGFHTLVHVVAGSPRDTVEKVTYLSEKEFDSPELATVLRIHVARLWGMTTNISRAERRLLRRLQIKGLEK